MDAVALLACARQAGLVVRREGDLVIVRGPKRLAHLATQVLDQKADVLAVLEAESDPAVSVALDVFTGARVVAVQQSALWPPEGGWIASSARIFDPYAADPPTVPCPFCRATTWGRAGSGWCCRCCHPDPRAPRIDHSQADSAAQTHPLLVEAQAKSFPSVPLGPVHPGSTVIGTAAGWLRFITSATSEELAAAIAALATRDD
jgi:hypothetical protein